MRAVLAVPALRQPCEVTVLASALGFAAACASKCRHCLDDCAGLLWQEIHQLVLEALALHHDDAALTAACKVVTQAASCRLLDATGHRELLHSLAEVILAEGGG